MKFGYYDIQRVVYVRTKRVFSAPSIAPSSRAASRSRAVGCFVALWRSRTRIGAFGFCNLSTRGAVRVSKTSTSGNTSAFVSARADLSFFTGGA